MSKCQLSQSKFVQSEKKTTTLQQPTLELIIHTASLDQKISAVPLEFEYLPIEMLSKEFTKFNNPHKYRIHYLGPRPINSFILHKKYGSIQFEPNEAEPMCSKDYNKYGVNMRKIVQSSIINQGLRTNNHYKNAIFYRAFEGMNPTLNLKDQIIFNSAFESGNLDCVIKPKPNVFDLFLRIDSNTRGHTQWYYFSVKNGLKNQKIKINICNITKGKTLYENGMKPYVFSRKNKQKLGSEYSWHQQGQNVTFQIKPLRYELVYENTKVSSLYELGFEYCFEYDDDEVFFAYSIPYTYSQLNYDISLLPGKIVKKSILGKTFTGVDIPVLHITNFNCQNERNQLKKNILITARIHPGQSNSSHMLNGFISFLISNLKEAIQLRNRVNFFIIPMANPDGVIMGNSRTGGAGKDLNRQFKSHKFQLYPQVYLIKILALKLRKKYGLCMYLDFHGHSRKKNTFFYGPPYTLSETEYYKCRVFPRLVQKINSSFRFYGCSFGLSEEKRKTGRGVMFQQIKIPYTYTIQSSIGLYYDFQGKLTVQFEQKAWTEMGKNIGSGLSQFIVLEQQYEEMMKERAIARLKAKQKNTQPGKPLKQGQNEEYVQNMNYQFKKLEDEQGHATLFQGMLQQIKQSCQKSANFDADLSSDDHDINQDLQATKLNEFNNLIVQGIQKDKGTSYKKFEQDELFADYPSKQLEPKVKESTLELKGSKRQIKITASQNINSQFRNRPIAVRSQSTKRKDPCLTKKYEDDSPVKEQKRLKQKNFVMANKQKYSIATKNFLINQNNRYEIIELPKKIQNIRKQLTKGRILINNLFQSKIKTQKQKQSGAQEAYVKDQVSTDRVTTKSSRLKRSMLRQNRLNPTIFQQKFNRHLQRISSTSEINRRSLPNRQNSKFSPGRKRTIDNVMDYEPFADIQLDNFAMKIKSFKGF